MPAATCGTSKRPAVDPDRFRTLMRRFATGVTVVTCPGPDGPEGITVNAFTSVSLRPPQVLVCLDRRSRTVPTMLTAGRFAVNVLGWEQRELATRLADRTRTPAQRFAGIRESTLVTGSPVVPDSLAVIDCLLAQVWPCGDHMLLVGDVVGGSAERVDEPLLFYEGGFCTSSISPSGGAMGSAQQPRPGLRHSARASTSQDHGNNQIRPEPQQDRATISDEAASGMPHPPTARQAEEPE